MTALTRPRIHRRRPAAGRDRRAQRPGGPGARPRRGAASEGGLRGSLGCPITSSRRASTRRTARRRSYRGPGLEQGLEILKAIKAEFDVPICTDLHEVDQAEPVAEVADLVQIPPSSAVRPTPSSRRRARRRRPGGLLHVKKGQFLAPWDCRQHPRQDQGSGRTGHDQPA